MIASWVTRRPARTLGLVVVGALLLAACSAGEESVVVTQTVTEGAGRPITAAPLSGSSSEPPASSQASRARFSASPRFGSTDVAPTQKVTVTAFNATITQVNRLMRATRRACGCNGAPYCTIGEADFGFNRGAATRIPKLAPGNRSDRRRHSLVLFQFATSASMGVGASSNARA